MDMTDTVRTGKCNLEFLSKVLKVKINIGIHHFRINRLKPKHFPLFDIYFHKIQPGGVRFSVHIAVNGEVENIITHWKDRIQHVE